MACRLNGQPVSRRSLEDLELVGTALGFFNVVSGGALLLASATAGALWSSLGAAATFMAGAALAAIGVFASRRSPR